jgi:GNAT superfamily N-acetyltransferase
MSTEEPQSVDSFEFRPVSPDDGEDLEELFRNSPDTGDFGVAPRFKIDPYVAYNEMYPTAETHGVAAIAPDGTFAGAGFLAFSNSRVGGTIRPTAYLAGLAVRKSYRNRGIAKQLAAERIDYARQHYDEDCVVYAHIQTGNDASEAVAQSWADKFCYQSATAVLQPLDEQPDPDDYTIRSATESEYQTIVERANDFHSRAELFSPYTVEEFRDQIESSPIEKLVRDYQVALKDGDIVAGTRVIDVQKLMWGKLENLPPEMQDADELPPEIPESREFRQTAMADVWYEPEHELAAETIIDTVRAWPDVGNRIAVSLDPDGPVGRVVDTDGEMFETRTAIQGLDSPAQDTFTASGI